MLWFRRKFKGTPSDLTSTAGGTTGSWFDRSDCSDQLLWWLSFFLWNEKWGFMPCFFLDACHDLEALHSWCLLFTCKMFLEFWFNLSSNTIFSRILSLVVSFVLYMRLNYIYIYRCAICLFFGFHNSWLQKGIMLFQSDLKVLQQLVGSMNQILQVDTNYTRLA